MKPRIFGLARWAMRWKSCGGSIVLVLGVVMVIMIARGVHSVG